MVNRVLISSFRLLHQFKNNAINANELALIDGVLYLETHIRSIAPLEEPRLMKLVSLFFLYGQEVSMKFGISCNDGKRYVS